MIADAIPTKQLGYTEFLFKRHFDIECKEVITVNVKHALSLDQSRLEKLAKKASYNNNILLEKIMSPFFVLLDSSSYKELGK